MSVLRALVVIGITVLPSGAATFGTVVTHPQPIADLVLDEARNRLYVANTLSNTVEIYSTTTTPPRLTSSITVPSTPLAIAISRETPARSLYVVCYGASTL